MEKSRGITDAFPEKSRGITDAFSEKSRGIEAPRARSIGERSLQKKVWLAMLRSMAPEVRVWSIGASRSMAL
ncbi:MAG: hypothetical protein K2H72_06265 [Muribaculaceae bacterium]|nr:hypothetical protein [Muribaculaceae bacterium]